MRPFSTRTPEFPMGAGRSTAGEGAAPRRPLIAGTGVAEAPPGGRFARPAGAGGFGNCPALTPAPAGNAFGRAGGAATPTNGPVGSAPGGAGAATRGAEPAIGRVGAGGNGATTPPRGAAGTGMMPV